MRNDDWRSRWEREQEDREEELAQLRMEAKAKEAKLPAPVNKKGQYLLPLEEIWTRSRRSPGSW